MNTKILWVVCGPTASGKTALAIDIALHLNTEIVNADSRQFFRELEIGVAKPNAIQLQTVRHHLVGHLHIEQRYTVADYEQEALEVCNSIFEENDNCVLCGGSGLYIDALTKGMDDIPTIDNSVKEHVARMNLDDMLSFIKEKDIAYYNEMDRQNPRRAIRAVEVILQSGRTYTSYRSGIAKQRPFTSRYIVIHPEKNELYERLEKRVDAMIEEGLEEEVRALQRYLPNKNLDTIGYREWIPYFEGLQTKAEVIEQIKKHTRNYAKRQITWFKRYNNAIVIEKADIQLLIKAAVL